MGGGGAARCDATRRGCQRRTPRGEARGKNAAGRAARIAQLVPRARARGRAGDPRRPRTVGTSAETLPLQNLQQSVEPNRWLHLDAHLLLNYEWSCGSKSADGAEKPRMAVSVSVRCRRRRAVWRPPSVVERGTLSACSCAVNANGSVRGIPPLPAEPGCESELRLAGVDALQRLIESAIAVDGSHVVSAQGWRWCRSDADTSAGGTVRRDFRAHHQQGWPNNTSAIH